MSRPARFSAVRSSSARSSSARCSAVRFGPVMPRPPITTEQLIAFAAGEVLGAEAARIEAYVRRHPEAAELVRRYRAVRDRIARDDAVDAPGDVIDRARAIFSAGRPAARTSWMEALETLVATLAFDSRVHPMAVRLVDNDREFQLAYEGEDVDVDLQARRIRPGREGAWQLMGQVSADEPHPGARVALIATEGDAVVETTADDRGMFIVDIPAGTWDVVVELAGRRAVRLPGIRMP